jgi:hypothetical protein
MSKENSWRAGRQLVEVDLECPLVPAQLAPERA